MIANGTPSAVDAVGAAISERLRLLLAQHPRVRRLAVVAARSADFIPCVLVLVCVWAVASSATSATALRLLAGVAVTSFAVRGMKLVFRRVRPTSDWGHDYRRFDPHAFPSGHAARVAVIATGGAFVLPGWAALALALWAIAVATSRVGLGVHYVSDVLAGLVLGIVLGALTGMA